MKKHFDAVKMTREIRDKMADLYWNDKNEYYRQIKIAAEKFKSKLTKSKKKKTYTI
ncbi:hypothetical protein HUU42_11895 [bacterium]|nr:hypothetical protein [bacterium]